MIVPCKSEGSRGVDGYLVLKRDVPDDYWVYVGSAWQLGTLKGKDYLAHALSQGLPYESDWGGGGNRTSEPNLLLWVPKSIFDKVLPTHNEYGELAP